MANLGEYFTDLATKAGIPNDDAKLAEVVKKVATIEFDDSIVNKLNSSYLTVEAAKNNPDLKKHFTASALNGVDAKVNALLAELGISDDVKNEILAEKSSYERIPMLVKKVKELEAAKAGSGKADKAELQKVIDDLNKQILDSKADKDKVKADLESQYGQKLTDFQIKNILSGYKYATPVDIDVNVQIAQALLSKELQAKEYKIVNHESGLRLETKDGMEPHHENKKILLKDFIDGVVAQNKLISVSGDPAQGNPPPAIITTPGKTGGKNTFAAAAEQRAQEYQQSTNG
jgi:hypothetical protein